MIYPKSNAVSLDCEVCTSMYPHNVSFVTECQIKVDDCSECDSEGECLCSRILFDRKEMSKNVEFVYFL